MKYQKFIGKEDDFQKAVARYLDSLGVLWFHCPNEGKVPVQYRAKQKAKGLKSGVLDILIFETRGKFNGLGIELKVGYNKPSDEQKNWLFKLSEKGWQTHWTNSLDEAIEIIDNYLKL